MLRRIAMLSRAFCTKPREIGSSLSPLDDHAEVSNIETESVAELSNFNLLINFSDQGAGMIPVLVADTIVTPSAEKRMYRLSGLAAVAITPVLPIFWFDLFTLSYAGYAFYQYNLLRESPRRLHSIFKLDNNQYKVTAVINDEIKTFTVDRDSLKMGLHGSHSNKAISELGSATLCTINNQVYSISDSCNVNQQLIHELY